MNDNNIKFPIWADAGHFQNWLELYIRREDWDKYYRATALWLHSHQEEYNNSWGWTRMTEAALEEYNDA